MWWANNSLPVPVGPTSRMGRVTVSFDRVGNVATPGGGETYDVTTSRLTGGAGTYSYDRAGNLIQLVSGPTTWTYGYDALNRLSSVTRNSVLIARYGYDVLGRRIVKRVYSSASGGTVGYMRFVYQGASVTFETDSGGTVGMRYTWGLGADNLLAMRDAAGNHVYVVQDPLGSVRALVKRGGTWLLSARYEPYGLISKVDSAVPGPGMAWRYRWTGREYDAETGWYFHRSRYYDPVVKRFVQEDPIGYRGGSNVYAYVDGNVLEATDPSGALAIYRMYEPDYSFHSDLLKAGATGPLVCIDGACGFSFAMVAGMSNALTRVPPGSLIEPWDVLTQSERNYTGNLAFNSPEARGTYLDLKRAAYNSGNAFLQEMLRRAEGGPTIAVDVLQHGPYALCGYACEGTDAGGVVHIVLAEGFVGAYGLPLGIGLAHEFGHLIMPPIGVPYGIVPGVGADPATEYSAFFYEDQARAAYGCPDRYWNHERTGPGCL
ncbi:MAG: hypothetical protein DMD52_09750 [Gemmatimonadetes bacterium]|nr:MAG: hypothetical protein DMD52_09750 [Gemmatimonadota bacterium]